MRQATPGSWAILGRDICRSCVGYDLQSFHRGPLGPPRPLRREIAMINVDPAEIAKFSELAHRWWDPHSEFRPLHEINPLRLEWIDRQASLAGKRFLDVGCGGGIIAEAMARHGATV